MGEAAGAQGVEIGGEQRLGGLQVQRAAHVRVELAEHRFAQRVLAKPVAALLDVQDVLGDELVEPVARLIEERRLNTTTEVCRVVGSTLGLTSAARGAAHYSLDRVFHDPTMVRA